MTKVIITAEVVDSAKWEAGFRSHVDLFHKMSIHSPIAISTNDNNEIAICAEPDDLDTYMSILNSPVTAEAMGHDGVKKDTVKVYVMDKSLEL